MPRRHGNASRRFSSEANREKRNNRVIKAFRLVDKESSSLISGIVRELESSESLPKLKVIRNTHQAFLLDPHSVNRQMSMGFNLGFHAAVAIEKARQSSSYAEKSVPAKIGEFAIVGDGKNRRRYVIAYLESVQLKEERRLLYESLAKHGFFGFKQQARHITRPTIMIGTLDVPPPNNLNIRPHKESSAIEAVIGMVHPERDHRSVEGNPLVMTKSEITEILDEAFVVHQVDELSLGSLQVTELSGRRS